MLPPIPVSFGPLSGLYFFCLSFAAFYTKLSAEYVRWEWSFGFNWPFLNMYSRSTCLSTPRRSRRAVTSRPRRLVLRFPKPARRTVALVVNFLSLSARPENRPPRARQIPAPTGGVIPPGWLSLAEATGTGRRHDVMPRNVPWRVPPRQRRRVAEIFTPCCQRDPGGFHVVFESRRVLGYLGGCRRMSQSGIQLNIIYCRIAQQRPVFSVVNNGDRG